MRSRPASTTRAFHLRSRLPAHSIAGSRRSSILPSPPVWRPHEPGYDFSSARAGVAHLVERDLAKVEVAGSKPVSRSNSPFASLRLVRGRPLLICRAPLAPVALQLSNSEPTGAHLFAALPPVVTIPAFGPLERHEKIVAAGRRPSSAGGVGGVLTRGVLRLPPPL